jgi:hypothetical protein
MTTATTKKAKKGIVGKFVWTGILVAIPAGVLWVANLPYPVIRSSVSKNAPILLTPSYMSLDQHYRLALTALEQAEQLIEEATSAADLTLGEQHLQESRKHLDALPTSFANDWSEYKYWWYEGRLSIYGLNQARSKAGLLEAKVFQERNAQTLLTSQTQTLLAAKQQYQQATTATDKQIAIAAWRSALNQLEQVPRETLAGKTAQNQLQSDQQELKELIGANAGNERINALITAAKQFSWQAAKYSQKPPHSAAKWREIENLWEQAINRLQEISAEDVAGYAEAQRLLAIYQANLSQVKVRRQAEVDSVEALEAAQRETESLLASIPANPQDLDRSQVNSRLQGIINQLEKVQPGTTVYAKGQELMLSAKNKLQQLQ